MTRVILSKLDRSRLSNMLHRCAAAPRAQLHAELSNKMSAATICEPAQIPPAVTTMNSRVLLLSECWRGARACSLVYPEDANSLDDRVSVLSPLGVQLLGAREGATLRVSNRNAAFEVSLLGVIYQPEANKHWNR